DQVGFLGQPNLLFDLGRDVLARGGSGEAPPEPVDVDLMEFDRHVLAEPGRDEPGETHGLGSLVRTAVDDDDVQGAAHADLRTFWRTLFESSRRSTGATSVPRSSMAARWSRCGMCP